MALTDSHLVVETPVHPGAEQLVFFGQPQSHARLVTRSTW